MDFHCRLFFLFFGLSNKQTPKAVEPHTELTLFYEQQINQQLVRLETTYSNRFEVPLRDVRAQMSVLDEEYKKLQASFNEQHQHPLLLLRAMIDNLQQRLEILIALEKQLNTKKSNPMKTKYFKSTTTLLLLALSLG